MPAIPAPRVQTTPSVDSLTIVTLDDDETAPTGDWRDTATATTDTGIWQTARDAVKAALAVDPDGWVDMLADIALGAL